MEHKLFKLLKNKLFLGTVLFIIVFSVFAFSVNEFWFKTDDLGNIISGLIRDWKDFIRIFSEDERNYIYPINFNVPKANFISGFFRPFQHIPFTIIYFLRGFDVYSYYLVNVLFHAFNSFLFFYLISCWCPIFVSFLGGLLFAFYPIYGWITWISTLHNFLAVFFMLLSLIFYKIFLFDISFSAKNKLYYYFAGLMFLFSILSRENTFFLGLWIFVGICFLGWQSKIGFWSKIKYSLSKTYIFFVAYFVYFLLRLNAFGISSLSRTFNNLLLRFPWFKKNLGNFIDLAEKQSIVNLPNSSAVNNLKTASLSYSPNSISWFELIFKKIIKILFVIERWFYEIFNFYPNNVVNKFFFLFLILFLTIFLYISYKKHLTLLLFFGLGILLFCWPGVVAYPNTRYINAMYPFLIGTFLGGIYFFQKKTKPSFIKNTVFYLILFLVIMGIFSGGYHNIRSINLDCGSSLAYKEKFARFFRENFFDKNSNFIVVGSPFVSDIQNVFQAFLNNLDLQVAHVRASTLAQKGSMGCRGDYRIKNVKSKIESVKINGRKGFRLTSLDKDYCAWWMNFSFFPLKWSKQEMAYIWSKEKPQVGKWHDFSMGKFFIHERLQDQYITDVTFLFDNKWINKNTIFITWDTLEGKYKVLESCSDWM